MESPDVRRTQADYEKDVLNILMDSDLYLELSLHERNVLVKHIVEFYRNPACLSADRTV